MPRLHESVKHHEGRGCDQYIAIIELSSCAECHREICPDCALPTVDPDLNVCSLLCGADFGRRQRSGEAA